MGIAGAVTMTITADVLASPKCSNCGAEFVDNPVTISIKIMRTVRSLDSEPKYWGIRKAWCKTCVSSAQSFDF